MPMNKKANRQGHHAIDRPNDIPRHLNNTDALKKIEDEMEMTPEISYIVNFIRESARGIIPAGK